MEVMWYFLNERLRQIAQTQRRIFPLKKIYKLLVVFVQYIGFCFSFYNVKHADLFKG